MSKDNVESHLLPKQQSARKNRSSAGFTLVELIMVVVILGILAAYAVPKIFSLRSDARRAAVESAHGSIQTTARIVNGQARITDHYATSLSLNYEGTNITVTNGYPHVQKDDLSGGPGIIYAAGIDENNFTITRSGSGANDTVRVSPINGAAANCYTQYSQASSLHAPPAITLDISAC